jgi:hypothetical protein
VTHPPAGPSTPPPPPGPKAAPMHPARQYPLSPGAVCPVSADGPGHHPSGSGRTPGLAAPSVASGAGESAPGDRHPPARGVDFQLPDARVPLRFGEGENRLVGAVTRT